MSERIRRRAWLWPFTPALYAVLVASTLPAPMQARTDRMDLFPKLQAGQTVTYQISYRTDKKVSAHSSLALADDPAGANIQVRALLRLEVLGVELQASRAIIHARTQFQSLDSDLKLKMPGLEPPPNQTQPQDPKET